ncbi:MAG: 2-amino-4-ketopentanoate thiolase [Firmicutes bacterium]|nr:2-amino-4-ketopentanoate thiolase [Bacillota bacterium]
MNQTVKKGEWVQIHDIILKPEERTAKIPEDTKKVPLEIWVKGFLNADAKMGDVVEVTTRVGRTVTGTLVDVNPTYDYGFGDIYIPELLKISRQVKDIVRGVEK